MSNPADLSLSTWRREAFWNNRITDRSSFLSSSLKLFESPTATGKYATLGIFCLFFCVILNIYCGIELEFCAWCNMAMLHHQQRHHQWGAAIASAAAADDNDESDEAVSDDEGIEGFSVSFFFIIILFFSFPLRFYCCWISIRLLAGTVLYVHNKSYASRNERSLNKSSPILAHCCVTNSPFVEWVKTIARRSTRTLFYILILFRSFFFFFCVRFIRTGTLSSAVMLLLRFVYVIVGNHPGPSTVLDPPLLLLLPPSPSYLRVRSFQELFLYRYSLSLSLSPHSIHSFLCKCVQSIYTVLYSKAIVASVWPRRGVSDCNR